MNKEAENFYNTSESCYKEACKFFEERKYPQSVDKFYDLVENILKCLLSLYKIIPPKDHKISELLPQIIEKIPGDEANKEYYSTIILPPFIAIHKMLFSIRNLTRYNQSQISQEQIINEGIATSVKIMIDYNYDYLKSWVLGILYNEREIN